MKKFKSIVVCMMLLVAVFAGAVSGGNKAYGKTANEKNAIKQFNNAAKKCKAVAATISSSWYYNVYEADKYYNNVVFTSYTESTGIPKKYVKSYAKRALGDDDWISCKSCLQVLSCNLDIVHEYHTAKKSFSTIKNCIKNGKKYTQKLPNSSKYKNTLKKYYKALNKYYKFVNKPTGSYNSLTGTLEKLNDGVDDCKSDLSW